MAVAGLSDVGYLFVQVVPEVAANGGVGFAFRLGALSRSDDGRPALFVE